MLRYILYGRKHIIFCTAFLFLEWPTCLSSWKLQFWNESDCHKIL